MQTCKHRTLALAMTAAIAILTFPATGRCFEADVHFGLTLWLAEKAGFEPGDAEAIALADQRIDAGSIEYMMSPLQFACLSRFQPDAREMQKAHYPSETEVPASTSGRLVAPGGTPALSQIETVLRRTTAGNAAFMLGEFGRSLHPLQDSWAHGGIPFTPDWGVYGIACDVRLLMAPSPSPERSRNHAAELTASRPSETIDMVKATYFQLLRYPRIGGRTRQSTPWAEVEKVLPGFINARTKSEKSSWFVANGISDTSFLDGISLPDGPAWNNVRWTGRRAIPTPADPSAQPGTDKEIRDFYLHFVTVWITTSPLEKRWLSAISSQQTTEDRHRLIGQLTGWRLRDHGAYLALNARRQDRGSTHGDFPADRAAYGAYRSLNDGILPLLMEQSEPSPVLPFIVFTLPDSTHARKRAIALLKLIDAPYDTLGVIAEKDDESKWKVIALISSEDY